MVEAVFEIYRTGTVAQALVSREGPKMFHNCTGAMFQIKNQKNETNVKRIMKIKLVGHPLKTRAYGTVPVR